MLTRQIIADKVDRIDLVAEKRHRACRRDAGRHREDRGRRGRGRRPRRASSPSPTATGAARSAPCCAAAISTPICSPMCWCANWSAAAASRGSDRGAGPPRRARRDHRQIPRMRGQHHRGQPPPHLHPAAGQGHRDRGRMRSARRRRRSTSWSARSRPPGSKSSAPRSTDINRYTVPETGQLADVNPHFAGPRPFSIAFTGRIKDFVTILGGRPGERTISLPEILRHQSVALSRICRARSSGRCSRNLTGAMRANSTKRSGGSASAARNRSPTARRASTATPASRCGSWPTSFTPNATQRKLIRRHADLEVSACKPWTTEEQYALLRNYLAHRHPGGGMARDGRA